MDSLIYKKEPTLVTLLQDHKMEHWTKWVLKLVFLCQFKLQTSKGELEELLLDKQHQPSHQTHSKRSSKLNLLLKIYLHPMADKLAQVEWDLMELLQLKMRSKLHRQCKQGMTQIIPVLQASTKFQNQIWIWSKLSTWMDKTWYDPPSVRRETNQLLIKHQVNSIQFSQQQYRILEQALQIQDTNINHLIMEL